MKRRTLAVVLAAGESKRMISSKSKVLHEVGNQEMIVHVLKALAGANIDKVALVLGRDAHAVEQAARRVGLPVSVFIQTERLGTGHAVLAARDEINQNYDEVIVVYGDTPLITADPLNAALDGVRQGHDIAVIGFQAGDPTGYGRLLTKNGELVAIREEKDASDEERKTRYCNSGLMAINGKKAIEYLDRITNNNAKQEYYLTDLVEIARATNGTAVAVEAPEDELAGCNNRAELAMLEAIWQNKKRKALMLSGVTMIAPETVFLSHDTEIEPDVTIEPNVIFGPGVRVQSNAVIHAFCHIEGALVGSGATVGPFARLRPGADLGQDSKVGNFCEVKKAKVGAGAKINHLSYIGDAEIGERSNIGAGTITCNYDGINKHLTVIGKDAFIGSNSALVAPVSVGDGALVASGSIITEDVPANAAAFGRARQVNKPDHAATIKQRNIAFKAAKKPQAG